MIFSVVFVIETYYTYTKIDILTEHQLEHKHILLKEVEYSVGNISDFIYENLLYKPNIREILKDINTNTDEDNNIVRDRLLTTLIKDYNTFTKYNIQQLHFHKKNNESFLRFHRPSKYGDNLTGIRKTVEYVNKNQKPIKGFEEGKIFSGYRFVYPFYDNDNNYIGSVEVSASFVSYKKFLEKDDQLTVDFIVDKQIVERKLFKSEKYNYATYLLNDNFYIRNIQLTYDDKFGNNNKHKQEFLSYLSRKESIVKKMNAKKSFYSIDFFSRHPHITFFVPLKNAISNKKVGYIVFIEHNAELLSLFYTYIIQLIMMLIVSIVISFILNKQIRLKKKTEELSSKYKVILDLSHSMIVVYENNEIHNANHTFLQFFDIDYIEQLKHKDISKYFVDTNKYTHPNSMSELKEKLREKNSHSIFMMNFDRYELEAFDSSIHYIDEEKDSFILEFNNITELFTENKELELRANYDKLTNIHNRHSFESIFLDKFKKMKQYDLDLSLIMFDIDHFKIINDEHGHNIGDEALKFLSKLVKDNIRDTDIFCRWGGEEFMILVDMDLKTAIKIGENLRKKIYEATNEELQIPQFSCSFGVVYLNDKSILTLTDGIEKVDTLLYQSKGTGRNKLSY